MRVKEAAKDWKRTSVTRLARKTIFGKKSDSARAVEESTSKDPIEALDKALYLENQC